MPALVADIPLGPARRDLIEMAGTSPAMTNVTTPRAAP